jgi:hypothetical protein
VCVNECLWFHADISCSVQGASGLLLQHCTLDRVILCIVLKHSRVKCLRCYDWSTLCAVLKHMNTLCVVLKHSSSEGNVPSLHPSLNVV